MIIFIRTTHLGELILISYSLNNETRITTKELEQLEKGIISNLNFIPYNVRVKGNASAFVFFRVNFKEVINGNIEDLRNIEKAYQKYLRGEMN